MPRVSIIITHWAMDESRSEIMRTSLLSLFDTIKDVEVFVVDNGDNLSDSKWLLEQTHTGQIACYVRNRKNMHFAYARNQALKLCSGEYIVIADNDILYRDGWLEECIAFLDAHPGNYMATPLEADPMNSIRSVRWKGEIDGWRLNYRAGSNCFIMRRKDFEKFGYFKIHRIAGSLYFDRTTRLGYSIACMPQPKAFDMALRKGYNINDPVNENQLL